MYNYNNNLNIKKNIAIAFIFALIFFLIFYFFFIKNKTFDPTVKIEDKKIPEESKNLLKNIGNYTKDVENKQKELETELEEKNKKQNNNQNLENNQQNYIPKNNIDGRKETVKTKEIVKNKKLKTASELGITEDQREYVLKMIAEPRLTFDDYYTTRFDQFFKTPAEFEKVKSQIIENYLNTYPEKAEKLFSDIDNEALKFLRRESKKYNLGKNDPEIIKTAKELGVDYSKI